MDSQAIRSTVFSPLDDDMVGLDDIERKALKEQELEDRKKLNQIKAISEHPGWQTIKKDILDKRINQYKSGEVLTTAVLDPKITDEELGRLTRVSLLVAEELSLIVNIIENAGSDEQ